MQIQKDTVASFHYVLSEVGGEVIEDSSANDPMAYLHGHENIFAVVEEALEGKSEGDQVEVSVSPAQGYGERNEANTQRIPRKHILTKGKLAPGMVVKVNTEQGPKDASVKKVGLKMVDLDTNHPLAGKQLHFAITIVSVREATSEELSHGHAHGIGGHQHD
ncbi:MAG: FKBP-type peptidyl-prolyl cis-trans isomerase [Pontibacterium sp.]